MVTHACIYVYQILAFAACNNLSVTNIHLTNSADKHMTVYRCSQVHVHNVTIVAPGDSPNTDGITMAISDHVYISNCSIQSGKKNPFIEITVYHLHIINTNHWNELMIDSNVCECWHWTNAGDDCVSMLSYTTDVNITDITCGPGHDIRYNLQMHNHEYACLC